MEIIQSVMSIMDTPKICIFLVLVLFVELLPVAIILYLQKTLNHCSYQYELINCGLGYGKENINGFEYMLDSTYRPWDIIVNINHSITSLNKTIQKHKLNFYETSRLFNRPHNHGHWMWDSGWHINHVGNEVITNYI